MFSTSLFIDECRGALMESNPSLAVSEILSESIKDRESIDTTLGPGDPVELETAQYNFLHQSPGLTILRVIMPPLLTSPPHNHLVWAVIGMYRGNENNVFYRRQGNRIEEVDHRNLSAPDVMVLDKNIIHGISNPLAQRSYALHVYGGALANPARSLWNPFTLGEEQFQLQSMLHYEREMMRQAATK